jgi:putative RecB family exonuclease
VTSVNPDAAAPDPYAAFPGSLSPSRANDFLTCPLLFRFRSIDRLPEPSSPAALRGTLVHSALEHLFDLPAADRTVARTRVLFTEAWLELAANDEESARILEAELGLGGTVDPAEVAERVLASALPLLDTYFALEDPSRLEPHARELGVSVEIAESFSIRGFVDRIDRSPAGEIRIVDYKTGKAPGSRYEAKAMFQMRFYALAWWRMTGDMPRMLQLMYLGSSEVLRYEPTEQDLLSTERKILALREAINAAARSGVFAPTTSRLCDWCAHRPSCPAWGGVLPPMPPPDLWLPAASRVDSPFESVAASASAPPTEGAATSNSAAPFGTASAGPQG